MSTKQRNTPPRIIMYIICLKKTLMYKRRALLHFTRKTRCFNVLVFLVLVLAFLLLYKVVQRPNASRVNRSNMESIQACIHPDLPVLSEEAYKCIKNVDPITCDRENDWVYTGDGKFFISAEAKKNHGNIECTVWHIFNANDSMILRNPIYNVANGSRLFSDAFKVECSGADGSRYTNVHACIAKIKPSKNPNNSEAFNILIYGYDSMSRNMFKRLLPKTHNYFTNRLGGLVLEGYNIIGDGTPQALMPILTGKQETDLPEVRRGKPGAKPVDERVTFIWKQFEKKGYVTQWGEDMANIGTFNCRMLGLKEQPVHHYMRAFQLYSRNMYGYFKQNCLGSRTRHIVFLDWLKEGLKTNRGHNFFTFGFFSELSHGDNSYATLLDDDGLELLKFMEKEEFLDSTIVMLMSDHGSRSGCFRKTELGKLEERMPYFGFLFPNSFQEKYPERIRAFQTNTKRLSTPFDIHETLLDILDDKDNTEKGISRTGMSLFEEIPKTRTCKDAGVDPHWCACMQWTPSSSADINVVKATQSVIILMNNMLQPFSTLCYSLILFNIDKAIALKNNENVLKFRKSFDRDGRVPDLNDTMKGEENIYQVAFTTSPGGGMFEATVRMNIKVGIFIPDERQISRLNNYGDAPVCIASKQPRLRPYCVCKS